MSILAPRAMYIRRLELCNQCPHLEVARGLCREILPARCEVCGCFVRIKAKIKDFHCPLPERKW